MRGIGLALGLVVLAGIAWLLLRIESGDGGVVAPGSESPPVKTRASAPGVTGRVPTAGDNPADAGPMCARIVVVDGDRAPLVGADVALFESADPDLSYWDAACRGKTDEAGAVTILPPGEARAFTLKVDPPFERREFRPRVVRDWKCVDTEVVLGRECSVAGIVTDPHNEPVPGASVLCRAEGYTGAGTIADKMGRFQIDGLSEGPVVLAAVPEDWSLTWAGGEPVIVKAGQQDVRLILRPDVSMTLVVRNREKARGLAHVWLQDHPEIERKVWVTSTTGGYWFRGLRPHLTYAIRFAATVDGYSPLVLGVRAVEGGRTVELQPGPEITGRLKNVGRPLSVHVYAYSSYRGHYRVVGEVGPDHSFRIRGLYPGTWTVNARASYDCEPYNVFGSAEVEAGGSADITLRAEGR